MTNGPFDTIRTALHFSPKTWLITGVAGFIGSHLLDALLTLDQIVIGIDNLSTGSRRNLEDVKANQTLLRWKNFTFIEGDIRDPDQCQKIMNFKDEKGTHLKIDILLHHAAMGSVAQSMIDPITTHQVNVDGFLNLLVAARHARMSRIVYASSSAVYGDDETLPKIESVTGQALSPYALSKQMNEQHADLFARVYGLNTIGLRYFNVYGPRQDPQGAYAAVIPKWINTLIQKNPITIHGTGETSRDFCDVSDVVAANILAACAPLMGHHVYNIGTGTETTLNDLSGILKDLLDTGTPVIHDDFRSGDIFRSVPNISRAEKDIGYRPTVSIRDGLQKTVTYYTCREETTDRPHSNTQQKTAS